MPNVFFVVRFVVTLRGDVAAVFALYNCRTPSKVGELFGDPMAIHLTGNAEIDQQHELLDNTVGRLAVFCIESARNKDARCEACAESRQRSCRSQLGNLSGELAAFLAGHSAYEEKMMELLPPTPDCQAHIKAHTAAHEGIARQLRKFSLQIDGTPPRDVSLQIMRVVGDWLGDHCTLFDTHLVHLGRPDLPKIDFDSELVSMLDQHVFPNRPTKAKVPAGSQIALRNKKLEMRGRFESLSPAQREVFWLVVGGRSNRDIADTLKITINTVKTHRAAVFQKMDVKSVLELVKKADILR